MIPALYGFAKALATIYTRVLSPMTVEGLENVPADGSVMLCCNHISMMDPVELVAVVKRPVRFMAKEELFRSPFTKWLFGGLGAIPVKRGENDLSSVRECLKLLREGAIVGVFPQGTRNAEGLFDAAKRKPMLTGAALIALKGNADIVPVLFPRKFRAFRRNVLCFGKPIPIAEYRGKADAQTLKTIMRRAEDAIWSMQDTES